MNRVKINKIAQQRELFVKATSPALKRNASFNLTQIKADYDRTEKELRNWNVFSGGGIGASVGLIACLTSAMVGVPVSSPEMFAIVGGSLFFGIIAGFILY